MSEQKHTDGPWKIGAIAPIEDGGYEAFIDAPSHGCLVKVVVAMEGEEENENPILMGNARLIAAAPDLLQAGKKQSEIIVRAQEVLTNYLLPAAGLSASEVVSDLLNLLDGPEQRSAQSCWDEAIAKATGAKE